MLAFDPDGKRIATADGDVLRLLDAATGLELLSLHGHVERITAAAFSPDGTCLATADAAGLIQLHDAGPELPSTITNET